MKIKTIFVMLIVFVLLNANFKDNDITFIVFNTVQCTLAIVYGTKIKNYN